MSNGSYDPRGLYSNDFFGQEKSTEWKNNFAKIVLPHPVFHPAIFYIINRRVSYLLKWINLEVGFALKNRTLVLTNTSSEYTYSGIIDIYQYSKDMCGALLQTGKFDTNTAKVIFSRIVDRKIPIFTSNVIVLPPAFREDNDDEGTKINKIYIQILDEINILRSAISSKDKILTNRILANIQNYYNTLFEYMVDKIKGKTGLIRAALLG